MQEVHRLLYQSRLRTGMCLETQLRIGMLSYKYDHIFEFYDKKRTSNLFHRA